MTIAICISCGAEKFGAWTPCPACGHKPQTKDDAMLSLALSEWFLDDDGRKRWAQQIQGGVKPQLDSAARDALVGFVTAFDEWSDVNAELEEAALELLGQRTFEAADLVIDTSVPPVPSYLYFNVADEASRSARYVLGEFAAANKMVNSDTMSDPWIVGYIYSALEWGLLGLGDTPTEDDDSGEVEEQYRLAFIETLLNGEQPAIDLLERIEQFEAAADSRFTAGRAAYGGDPLEDAFAGEQGPLANYLNGVFICWLCKLERKRTEADSDTCDICGVGPAGLVYQAPGARVEIEGSRVASWGGTAPRGDLEVLVNAEYSDAEAEYVLHQVENTGATISVRNHEQALRRNWQFFSDGTFFLDHGRGTQLLRMIEDALSPADREILNAREYLRRYGIITTELGGDLVVRKIYQILRGWDQRKDVPEGSDWQYMIDIFRDGSSQLRSKGTSLVRIWVEHVESNGTGSAAGSFDVYRRVGLAALYRHSGQFDKALAVSEIVELPMNRLEDRNSLAVLCTTRAATLMDLAENKPQERAQLLKSARLTLNKANAMSGADSDYVREAYMRLKKLEADAAAEKQRENDHAAWKKIGKLPPES